MYSLSLSVYFFINLVNLLIPLKLKQFADCFPNTMLKGHKFQAISRDDYQKLVVCRRCNRTYEYDDCLKDATGKRNNAKC